MNLRFDCFNWKYESYDCPTQSYDGDSRLMSGFERSTAKISKSYEHTGVPTDQRPHVRGPSVRAKLGAARPLPRPCTQAGQRASVSAQAKAGRQEVGR